MTKSNLIIIGSGPAGYTAALYAARAQLAPLLFEGKEPGGQLMLTTDVENFPGFPEGLLGPELMDKMKKQAVRFGTTVQPEFVTGVDFSVQPFVMKTSAAEYQASAVILSMGASALWLDVPGEKQYQGHGVSACATCDGFFFKDKHVVVVGGGDAAMEEANFLTKFATKVSVMVRREALRASKIMQERAEKNPKIEFIWNTEVQEVLGDPSTGSGQAGKMTGVKLFNNKTQQTSEFSADGLFVSIGHKPNSDLVKGQIDVDEKGYVKVEPWGTKTNVPGVFACGDLVDHKYRQAVTAAGTGCMAALDAERYLAHGSH